MKIKLLILVALALSVVQAYSQPKTFTQFTDEFVAGYKSLHLPDLELSYVSNLKQIKSAADVQKQIDFFTGAKKQLQGFNINKLNAEDRQDYREIIYESALNLERLKLEEEWVKNKPDSIPTSGVYHLPNGKAWYKYLLKKWLSAEVTPEEIYAFGLKEVDRVSKHIEDIRKQSGLSEEAFYKHLNDPEFFISDPEKVQQAFEQTQAIIYKNFGNVFNPHQIPELKIKRGENSALAQTPGYYNENTFYYNLFAKPYNKRQVDWLFIHEAVPGHHYQSSIYSAEHVSKVQDLFFYIGLAEGWGAYTEELGKQLGVYRTPYDELGKWEWDIVRSVRVPMDIGLNYYGWTDAQALAFWKQHIKNQDDIALREIARVKRWPAQAITYKYGAGQILEWQQTLQKKQGAKFDIKDFHDRILNHGSLPIFMVKENVFR